LPIKYRLCEKDDSAHQYFDYQPSSRLKHQDLVNLVASVKTYSWLSQTNLAKMGILKKETKYDFKNLSNAFAD